MTFSEMFSFEGKTAKIIGKKRVATYHELFEYLTDEIETELLPSDMDYLGENELAKNIYRKKYYLKDLENKLIETRPEDVFKRVASFTATVEPTRPKQRKWAEQFYRELYEGRFMPGGRVLAGSGDLYRLKTLANCFVAKIEKDDIDSIYKAAYECARTYSYGGGIGVDISSLRPQNAIVHNAADTSSGAVSFMELYSLTTGLIGQSGRRGALMLTIDVKHPDILQFIKVKKIPNWVTSQIVEQCKYSGLYSETQLRNIEKQVMENTQVRFANISIKVSDEFMHAVYEQRNYGNDKYLVYKKLDKKLVMAAPQSDACHYSSGIPSKDPSNYEIKKTFSSFMEMNNWIFQEYGVTCRENDLSDAFKRDVYGDLVYQLDESDYDLAVKQAGDFLLYFSSTPTGEIRRLVKARDIWDQFIEGNYKTAEPGLIFWTTMSRFSPSNYVGRPIISTNPCAEVPLEDGGACNLGSINLSRFVKDGYSEQATIDWDQLADTTRTLVRFLDNVVTWNEQLNALEKQRIAAAETRRLGLGIMGAADMLNQLAIHYDSEEGIETMGRLMSFIANAAYQASAGLAEEKGESPIFDQNYLKCPFIKEALSIETQKIIKEKGIRNIAILSIAPTGTISNIVLGYRSDKKNYIGVSGGLEPIFALYYTRRSESFGNQMFKVFHATVRAYIDKMGLQEAVEKTDDLESLLPDYFSATSHQVDPMQRVKIQGYCQKYVDHSISSTVNLPEDIEPEVISDIYILAWKNKLKGITIYRDGSRFPILSTEGKRTLFQDNREKTYKIVLPDGTETHCKGDEILKLPNGDLTTVYHYVHKQTADINVENHTSLLEEIRSDQTN